MTAPRLLHVGQRKTGTTWLQHACQRAAEAGVIAFAHWELADWARPITLKTVTDADFDALARLLPTDRDLPAMASQESLAVHDPDRVGAALARAWPDAQVLVTTRAPRDYLLSSLNNDSVSRGDEAEAFVTRFARHMRRAYDFDRMAAAYARHFGEGRVHFLPYELLARDPAAYLARVGAILGADVAPFAGETRLNASPPPAYLAVLRQLSARLRETAPEVLEMPEWRGFVLMANVAAGAAKGIGGGLDTYLADMAQRRGDLRAALPVLPAAVLADLASRMQALRGLDAYRDLLPLYGLAPLGREEAA